MSENDITLFKIKLKDFTFPFGSHLYAILVCGFIGFIISNLFKLTLNNDVWSNFFSLIPQIFVVFITVIIVFYIARIELISENSGAGNSAESIKAIKKVRNETVSMLTDTIPIIIVSIILMPLGYLELENSWIVDIWNNFRLDWFFIFGAIGFSLSTFYKILDNLQKLLTAS